MFGGGFRAMVGDIRVETCSSINKLCPLVNCFDLVHSIIFVSIKFSPFQMLLGILVPK